MKKLKGVFHCNHMHIEIDDVYKLEMSTKDGEKTVRDLYGEDSTRIPRNHKFHAPFNLVTSDKLTEALGYTVSVHFDSNLLFRIERIDEINDTVHFVPKEVEVIKDAVIGFVPPKCSTTSRKIIFPKKDS